MLHHVDALTLPFKEGFRDLRSSLRFEARGGGVSSRLFGKPGPTREAARIADGILSQAERVAMRALNKQDRESLGARMDRLARILEGANPDGSSREWYKLFSAVLDRGRQRQFVVSEMRLADAIGHRSGGTGDVETAASLAVRLASAEVVRPCFSTIFYPSEAALKVSDITAHVALNAVLAVLVRARRSDDPAIILESVRWVVEAESSSWLAIVKAGRSEALAREWREVLPYLP